MARMREMAVRESVAPATLPGSALQPQMVAAVVADYLASWPLLSPPVLLHREATRFSDPIIGI